MTYENLEEANARVQALEVELKTTQAGLVRAVAEVATAHMGAVAPLFANMVHDRLKPHVDKDGKFSLRVAGEDGKILHARKPDGRFDTMSVSQFVDKIPTDPKFKRYFEDTKDQPGERVIGKSESLTAAMQEAAQRRAGVTAPLSESEKATFRCRNPWARDSLHLTTQMQVTARDPLFAAELKGAAA